MAYPTYPGTTTYNPYSYINKEMGRPVTYAAPPPTTINQYAQPVYTPPPAPAPVAPSPVPTYAPTISTTATSLTNALATPPPTIQSPPSVATLIPQILTALPAPPQIPQAPSLAEQFKQYAPTDVAGKGGDYYTSMRDQILDALRQEYFGPLGTVQQTASAESAAGRLGSGVGKRVLEEAAFRPFNDAYVDANRQVLQLQAEEQASLRQFNAEQRNQYTNLLGTLAARDSENELQRNIANTTILMDLNKLALTAAAAERGELGREATAQLEASLRVWEQGIDAYLKQIELAQQFQTDQQKLSIEYLRTPLNEDNLSEAQKSYGAQFGQYFSSPGGTVNTMYRV